MSIYLIDRGWTDDDGYKEWEPDIEHGYFVDEDEARVYAENLEEESWRRDYAIHIHALKNINDNLRTAYQTALAKARVLRANGFPETPDPQAPHYKQIPETATYLKRSGHYSFSVAEVKRGKLSVITTPSTETQDEPVE